ncbi:MAG: HD domain-containing protein, partial [Rickettsiales bacterium]|nr:HD domain-containing protein [Rickettsiales bacterium]
EPCQYSIRLTEKLKSLDTQNVLDFELINKAIYWARKYHGDQKRKSGDPYYSHPLEVAYMVSEYKLKTDVIAASILHDIVEDTEVTVEMIEGTFGQRIAEMVDRLTRDRPNGTKLSVEDILYNNYIKNDIEVILIKCIDRVHNMQTIKFKDLDKQEKTSIETLKNFLILSESMEWAEISEQLYIMCNNLNCTTNDIKQKQKFVFGQSFVLPALQVFENNKH